MTAPPFRTSGTPSLKTISRWKSPRNLYRRLVPEDRDSHLAPEGSISRINLDFSRELRFDHALTVVAKRGHPEELAAVASLVQEGGVEEADARYEAFMKPLVAYVGEAKTHTIEMLRTKARLFTPVSPRSAINAYARLLGLAKTDASALEEMAGLLGDSGDFPGAAKYYRELLGYEDLSALHPRRSHRPSCQGPGGIRGSIRCGRGVRKGL